MKPKDVKMGNALHSDSSFKYIKETNKKDIKFKIGDHVRIAKYKNIFSKGYLPGAKTFLLLIKYKIPFLGLI